MGFLSGFMAGAGEQLVSVADQRIARYREEDLAAARLQAEKDKEARIEAASIRSEGRAEVSDTRKRGLIYAEETANEKAEFERKNDPSYVQTENGTAKAKAEAERKIKREQDSLDLQDKASPGGLKATRDIARAKRIPADTSTEDVKSNKKKIEEDKKTEAARQYISRFTPEQLKAALEENVTKDDLGNTVKTFKDPVVAENYKIANRRLNADNDPQYDALASNRTSAAKAPAKSSITPRAEYDKLPVGSRYTGPDGKPYIKRN